MARNKGSEKVFADAVKDAKKPNYLGDYRVVEAVLRLSLSRFIKGLEKAKSNKDRRLLLEKESKYVGGILLGRNKEYVGINRWNEPGGIDEFLAKWLGLAETQPDERMEHALVKFFNRILDLSEYVEIDEVLEEQARWQLDAIVKEFINLFLGIDLPTQNLMEIKGG